MATSVPRPQSPQQTFQFTPTSPPDSNRAPFNKSRQSVRGYRFPLAQQPSTESRRSGHGATNGSMPVPDAAHPFTTNGEPPRRSRMSMNGMPPHAARSPPNAKNTSHVPCKFFRLGQCQAGKACPFSHSIDVSSVDTPCKYFAKGNCKFGAKCMLAHILPNGKRVNRPTNMVGGQLNLGGRVDPQMYHSDSALANSLLAQQTNGDPMLFGPSNPHLPENDYLQQAQIASAYRESIAPGENGYQGHYDSQFGSPRDDGRLAVPPVGQCSTLDAPMPASFDSQGISYIARHGPVAASVPSKFGLESPPSSLPKKAGVPSSALRNLHSSAFGQEPRSNASNLGSSPHGKHDGSGDEGYNQHTLRLQHMSKPTIISASVPRTRVNDDWDEGILFGGEEDFLPSSLHDLLTPQEKLRRQSKTEPDDRSIRESLSGLGTPADSTSHVGSPSHASPSRFSAFFAQQKREEQSSSNASVSAVGHVGSPLRNSSLHIGRSSSVRATSNPTGSGSVSPYLASPPRQSSMSAVSQQLARTRISSRTEAGPSDSSTSNGLHPSSARIQSQGPTGLARLDVKANAASNSNKQRIDEELSEGVFSMEEEEESQKKSLGASVWNLQQANGPPKFGARSPQLRPIGTGRDHRAREVDKVSREYWS